MSPRAVVAMTTSDRLDCAAATLDSWRGVRGVEDALFVVSCEPCEPMVSMLGGQFGFTTALIEPGRVQLGNESNTWKALRTAFATGADFVIGAEDDVLVSADVLEYFAWAQREYAADEGVLTVSGFQNAVRGGPGEVFRRQWFTGCVWGIWRGRWDRVKDAWPGGPTPHSWDWYLCEVMRGTGTVAIEPCQTRGRHIGVTGAHGSHPEHLAREWEAQRFTAAIPPQAYREIPAP